MNRREVANSQAGTRTTTRQKMERSPVVVTSFTVSRYTLRYDEKGRLARLVCDFPTVAHDATLLCT